MRAPLASLQDAKSAQGAQRRGAAHLRQPGDLAGRQVLAAVELCKVGFAPQLYQPWKRDCALYKGWEARPPDSLLCHLRRGNRV